MVTCRDRWPTGTSNTSQDALDKKQLSILGWSKIDFNWKGNDERVCANFFGCKTGLRYSRKKIINYYLNRDGTIHPEYSIQNTSFAQEISALRNFANILVRGQTSSSFPSQYTNIRINSENGSDNFIEKIASNMIIFYRTYLVGCYKKIQDINLNEQNVSLPMQTNMNGQKIRYEFQEGDRKNE